MAPFLPAIFRLERKPYQLIKHRPFEPIYSSYLPKQRVLKCGRQLGKCRPISAREPVLAANGQPLLPEELQVGTEVLSIDERLRAVREVIVAIHKNGRQPLVRIRTALGAEFTVTPDHPLRTLYGYTPAGELQPGSRVAGLRRGGRFDNRKQPIPRVIATAYWLGDGCYGAQPGLCAAKPVVRDEFCRMIELLGEPRPKPAGKKERSAPTYRVSMRSQFTAWLREDGLYDKRSYEKRMPRWVFQLSRRDTQLFLSRLWATDGTIRRQDTYAEISYTSTSAALARDVRALLWKLGIPSEISRKKRGYRKHGQYKQCRDAYTVRVRTREGLENFQAQLRVPGKPPIELPTSTENDNRDTAPIEVGTHIRQLVAGPRKHGQTLRASGLRCSPKYPLSRGKLRQYVEHFANLGQRDEFLESLADGDIYWDTIKSVERLPAEETWDIETSGNHNYILDGVVAHNSTNAACSLVCLSISRPFFKTLVVTPLSETVKRFSTLVVRPFIDGSPVRDLIVDPNLTKRVLQRSYRNGSVNHFQYAFRDCDRIRGLTSHYNIFDEVQDMDPEFVPIINETMSASEYGSIVLHTGTPKTLENTLSRLYDESSMAEWCIPCPRCHYDNLPALRFDLDRMTGPFRDDISEASPGLVCAKCQRPLDPRAGFWWHERPELRYDFPGYHMPQQIMPQHCFKVDKWLELCGKREGQYNFTPAKYYNEVCGEAYDSGARLITIDDLKAACILGHDNKLEEALKKKNNYDFRVLSVDWGGGGAKGTSWTVMTVLGWRGGDEVDVLYSHRSLTPHDRNGEARMIIELLNLFGCWVWIHDYTGQGALRETIVINSGFPSERVMPMWYVRAGSQALIRFIPPSDAHPREHYKLDKARSLSLTCELIRHKKVRFFNYDFKGSAQQGLIHDFLALVEDQVDSRLGRDVFTIIKDDAMSDDFAQTVNQGVHGIYYLQKVKINLYESGRYIVEGPGEMI